MLEIKGLNIKYGNQYVLKNVNFCAKEGITCLVGYSGSGKSSLLNALMYHIPFQYDYYTVYNTNFKQCKTHEIKRYIRSRFSYISQKNNFISDISCYDNIRLYANFDGKKISDKEIKEILNSVGLNLTYKTMPNNLSGGERQRLALAQALAKDTDILLCDEITASLDPMVKVEIMDLLRKIADQYKRIIIITTHDEDVYNYCDDIYEITDRQLTLLKRIETKVDTNKKSAIKKSTILPKIIRKYNVDKIERQYGMAMLYSIISALVISLSSFLLYFGFDYISSQYSFLSRQSDRELFVINQSIPIAEDSIQRFYYAEDNMPFTSEIYSKIKKIENVEEVYPFYVGTMIKERGKQYKGPITNKVSIINNRNEKSEIELTCDINLQNIFPYYKEQSYEYEFNIASNVEEGAYINSQFLQAIGYSEDDVENCSIETEISLPVAYTIFAGNVSIGGNEPIDTDFYIPIYKSTKINIPIVGIIPDGYAELIGGQNIYLPYAYMENLRSTLANEYVLKENEISWSENAYIIMAEESKFLNDINIDIKKIDTQIATGSTYVDFKAHYQTTNYIIYTAIISLCIVFLVGCVLSYLYGIFYYQKNQEDIEYFKRNGLLKKEWKLLVKIDVFIQSVLTICISIPLTLLINFFAKDYVLFTMIGSVLSIRFLLITVSVILFSFIQTAISRMYYYRKAVKS